jgi:hypothetical protein
VEKHLDFSQKILEREKEAYSDADITHPRGDDVEEAI